MAFTILCDMVRLKIGCVTQRTNPLKIASKLMISGSYGAILVEFNIQVPARRARRPLFPSHRACTPHQIPLEWIGTKSS